MNEHDPIRALAPTPLWNSFVELNAVPRPSKKEKRVSDFVEAQGKSYGLDTKRDSWGNILIRKPGSLGFEAHPTVVLQSHIDMVCQKNADTDFDFETQGIEMWIDGDWVKARGTTLGADNGIGVATMLATLQSKEMKHPPLECLFTIDEETGMTGAKELDPTWLHGKVLLNLDTEQDNELTIGCAGGADVTAKASYSLAEIGKDSLGLQLSVRGLTGGHSGTEIHLGRGNANKLMNRLLWGAFGFGAQLVRLEGGSLRNAIPRESTAIIAVPKEKADSFAMWVMKESLTMRIENEVTDPSLQIQCVPAKLEGLGAVPKEIFLRLLSVIAGTISGIQRMSPSIAGLVQTSNNLARVVVEQGQMTLMCLARSSVDSERVALTESLKAVQSILGGEVTVAGEYPGWQPIPDSAIVRKMQAIYDRMFGSEPHVAACHAGLECGIIGSKFPGMEMVSFGPNILGAHSPDERVQISSVQKFFRFYTEVLASL